MKKKYRGYIPAACNDAFNIISSTPSAMDLALKRYLVSQASKCKEAEQVVDALCYLGILWRDISVYTDALNICQDVMKDFILPSSRDNDIVAAINCFGFEEIQKRCAAPTLFSSRYLIMKHTGWIHFWSIRHSRLSDCLAISRTSLQLTQTRRSVRK